MGNKFFRPKLSHEEAWGAFAVLPPELVLHILRFADAPSLCWAGGVNTTWRDCACDDALWSSILLDLVRQDPHDNEARGSAEGGGGEEAELQAGLAITKSCKALVKEVTVLRKRASAEAGKYPERACLPQPGVRSMLSKFRVGKLLIEGRRSLSVIMAGLDAAGKTTMLYALETEPKPTMPCIGFNVEHAAKGKLSLTCWDVGGPDKIRPLWRHYFQGIDAIIWVVDLNDRERMSETAHELFKFMSEDQLRGLPLLLYGNKIDLPRALSIAEATEQMDLHQIRGRKWHFQPCCAITQVGLYEGLSWLAST